MECGAYTAV